ncbi:IS21 family transposase, partial [bacterium AH-315-L21]|nr:IS21 family transposase [bacterium AH-315-L21]
MLKMAQIEYIKFLYEEEGKSLTQIAKELKMNFRTVKKYAQEYNWSPNIKQRKKRN